MSKKSKGKNFVKRIKIVNKDIIIDDSDHKNRRQHKLLEHIKKEIDTKTISAVCDIAGLSDNIFIDMSNDQKLTMCSDYNISIKTTDFDQNCGYDGNKFNFEILHNGDVYKHYEVDVELSKDTGLDVRGEK